MKKSLFALLLLWVVSLSFGNNFADNGGKPGELYIYYGDEEIPSSGEAIFYFSPDTGRTLIANDTFPGSIYCPISSTAADESTGIVYVNNFWVGWISYNYGINWIYKPSLEEELHSGLESGEVAHAYGYWSLDYGETGGYGAGHGWVPISSGDADVGVHPGALFALAHTGALIATFDYSDNYDTLCILPNGGIIRSGAKDAEMFAIIDRNVYYSHNACTTFILTGSAPSSKDFLYDYCCGWSSNEIYAIGKIFWWDGGEIEIWRSANAGSTWNLIHLHTCEITERKNPVENETAFYSFSGGIVKSEYSLKLYDITGHELNSGSVIDISKYPRGIYLISDGSRTSKIFWLK
jgi:hypothetical protein